MLATTLTILHAYTQMCTHTTLTARPAISMVTISYTHAHTTLTTRPTISMVTISYTHAHTTLTARPSQSMVTISYTNTHTHTLHWLQDPHEVWSQSVTQTHTHTPTLHWLQDPHKAWSQSVTQTHTLYWLQDPHKAWSQSITQTHAHTHTSSRNLHDYLQHKILLPLTHYVSIESRITIWNTQSGHYISKNYITYKITRYDHQTVIILHDKLLAWRAWSMVSRQQNVIYCQ